MPKPTDNKSLQIQIDPQMEKMLVETVIEYYNAAAQDRLDRGQIVDAKGVTLDFDRKIKMLNDMYYGKRAPKSVPWTNCSNRSMKIAMAIIDLLHARTFPAVWNEDLVRWKPTEITDKKKAERITKLMDWWVKVRTKMRDFYDRWVKVCLSYGYVTTEVSWEIKPYYAGDVIEQPITDEFGIQLYEKDGTPSISKEKRYKFDEKTKTEIVPIENVYLQKGQTSLDDEPVIIKCNWKYSELEAMENNDKAVNVSRALHENESTVLKDKLMNLINTTYAYSDNDNIETIKEVKLNSTSLEVLKCYIKIDIDRDGFPEDVRVIVDPVNRIYLGGVEMHHITKRGKRPIDITKINDYLEHPDSLDGYGYLEIIQPLAEELDAIFNQLTDANTLGVLRPGFYDPSGSLIPQNITIAPNKLIPVPDPQRNVYYPDFQIPTERLLLAMKTVLEFIERLTGASSYVMGKESEIVGGSGTATRTNAIMMSAEQRFAIPAQRLRAGAARILTLLLDQLQKNFPPGLEKRILGEDGQPIFDNNELTTEGISGELDAYIMEDPSMGSVNMERQLATMLYATLLQNPLVASDPVKLYKETAFLLTAFGQDPVEHLGPEPEGADFMTPEQENTMLVQGDVQSVRAKMTENHIQHISVHKQLPISPTMVMMQPGEAQMVLQAVEAHVQEHMMMMQQMLQMTQQFKGGAGGQAGGANQAQGNAQFGGMGNISEPLGQMAAAKKQGTAGNNPAM